MTWHHPALGQKALDESDKEIAGLRAEIERLRAALTAISSMRCEDLYYADGQPHDNAAAAAAASALEQSGKGEDV